MLNGQFVCNFHQKLQQQQQQIKNGEKETRKVFHAIKIEIGNREEKDEQHNRKDDEIHKHKHNLPYVLDRVSVRCAS